MRKPYKMNLLYLLSFILLCVCFMVFIFAVIFIIRYDNKLIGELIAVIFGWFLVKGLEKTEIFR